MKVPLQGMMAGGVAAGEGGGGQSQAVWGGKGALALSQTSRVQMQALLSARGPQQVIYSSEPLSGGKSWKEPDTQLMGASLCSSPLQMPLHVCLSLF